MKKLIHAWSGLDRIHQVIERDRKQTCERFALRTREEFGLKIEFRSQLVSPVQSTVFLCTHHSGPTDFLAAFPELTKIAPNLKVLVNRKIRSLAPIAEGSIGVHAISERKRNKIARDEIKSHLRQGGNLLVFPAGKVATKVSNVVTDLPWRLGIADLIREEAKQVVPVYVEAVNSDLFYLLRRFFPKLSLLLILRTLRTQNRQVIPVYVGAGLERNRFDHLTSLEILETVREQAYQLPKSMSKTQKETVA